MTFEWFVFQYIPHLNINLGPRGYLATLVFVATTIALFWRCYADFSKLVPLQWGLLVVTILVTPLLAQTLILSYQPAQWLKPLSIPLFGLIPLLVAAVWLGAGPALLVGLSTGLTWALFGTSRLSQPFEIAILGFAAAMLINQTYRGRFEGWLRHPLAAMLLAAFVVGWPLQVAGIFLLDPSPALASLDHTLTSLLPTLFATGIATLFAGLLIEIVVIVWPHLHPAHGKQLQTAPWTRHLSQRVLYILVPLTVLTAGALIGTVMFVSYRVATHMVLDQVTRDASNIGNSIPVFLQTGRSLLREIAQNEAFWGDDRQARQDRLEEALESGLVFAQLLYFDADLQLVDAYPAVDSPTRTLLLEEEEKLQLTLKDGVPVETTSVDRDTVTINFMMPVNDPDANKPLGVLVGRTALADNPAFAPVANLLQGEFIASSEGLLANTEGYILYYPAHSGRRGEILSLDNAIELSGVDGRAFRQLEADGTRRLVYIQQVTGQPEWSVIMLIPNEASLALAVQIVVPALVVMLLIAGLLSVLLVALVRRMTVPLEELLQAVDLMAEEEFDHPIEIAGEDEAGRLGRAFEAMRIRLKNRLDELERLLRVSRGVSGNLELFRAMPTILNSALEVAQARGVRIVLREDEGKPLQVYTVGEAATAMAPLDAQMVDLVERQGTVVISQVWRVSGSLDITMLPPYIRAIVALPLRSDTSFHGILWLGYDHEHVFEQSEMTFLSTLASQAAIAVSTARLFAQAEEGRRKLEAVLTSTADGMIVTDKQGKIILVNPAAEDYFGIRGDQARGRKATEVIDVPALAALLTNLEEPVASLEFPDGRNKILLANTSTIVSSDGAIAGRVAVLRDITALKELDNIKTVFLRMVSHDLRSPLTYMRGYLSMLPLTGELNPKQQDAMEKIGTGIEHISEMTERLLYLSRLKFGEDVELELVLADVKDVIEELVQGQSKAAEDKNIELRIEVEDKLPLLLVDVMLYRQAIMNLINNAIKCTPENGEVIIQAFQEDEGSITTRVIDNGIGIPEEFHERLFEAFYRVPQREGEPDRPRGTGLGLVLVKTIAEVHEGSVAVESVSGEGSTFTITLPLRSAEDIE
ncbi:MAG: PAS domain S-box protein [Anaerolineae bacterium]|nr:PAS domain S-box protein [Anaerolineae bacterium]